MSTCLINSTLADDGAYAGSTFTDVKARVFTQAYSALPYYEVNRSLFGPKGDQADNQLLQAARRTLNDPRDFLAFAGQQKLLNANGICFAGQWRINDDSPYGGQFSAGTVNKVIARASVALSGTEQGDKRAFGLALKLFPTLDPEQKVKTINTFVMHSLGGVRSDSVYELALSNQPVFGSLPPLSQLRTALRMRKDLERANSEQGDNPPPLFYQPLSNLAGAPEENQPTPHWLRLSPEPTVTRVDAVDFRDELAVSRYPSGQLVWHIELAPANASADKKKAQWQRLGRLVFTESIVSLACDTQLHFSHQGHKPSL